MDLFSDWLTGRGPTAGKAGGEGRGSGHQDEGAGAATEGGERLLMSLSVGGKGQSLLVSHDCLGSDGRDVHISESQQ